MEKERKVQADHLVSASSSEYKQVAESKESLEEDRDAGSPTD